MKSMQVLLVDDHAFLRVGLQTLIDAQPDMVVAGEAATAQEALSQARAIDCNVAVVDVGLPDLSGIRLVELMRREFSALRLLVLTMHDDEPYAHSALAAGAAGFLTKTAAPKALIHAIRVIHRGGLYVDSDRHGANQPNVVSGPRGTQGFAPADALSAREIDVLRLLAQGYTNQEAAARLFVSVKTIETYRTRIGKKLGLASRADLIRYGLEMGIVTTS
ncbi:MAG: response regulator transcription factor [Gemmataceae bacterium]|nr:response regulator transcription factor [Gemmataceae bacterium]